ncbi:metal ABC transporter permease [Jannaschia seosinensis]|uniref:metal ABC transporter permease n=1 Tax=Jannaschia seosinensis TaxID=313367 RepID=UPI0006E2EFDD|nr:metal ABC transporter permease [Jannaschia seosinensis]
MFDSLVMRAAAAGLGVALVAGPLGCFVVWRRMAYFSDATAHASILGVALALVLDVPVFGGVLVVAFAAALALWAFGARSLGQDTGLGVMAHSTLAFGLVAVSFLPSVRIDISAYLFGDILAVRERDLALIWGGGAIVLALLAWRWSRLLIATLGADMAHAAGVNPRREELLLTVALAILVAAAIKVVGALLVGALLVIPAATARGLTRTPEAMAATAALIGGASALGGIWMSWEFDTPTGPSIVCWTALAFVLSQLRGVIR